LGHTRVRDQRAWGSGWPVSAAAVDATTTCTRWSGFVVLPTPDRARGGPLGALGHGVRRCNPVPGIGTVRGGSCRYSVATGGRQDPPSCVLTLYQAVPPCWLTADDQGAAHGGQLRRTRRLHRGTSQRVDAAGGGRHIGRRVRRVHR